MTIILRELSFSDVQTINQWRNNPELISKLGSNFRYINMETDEQWFKNYMSSRHNTVRCGIHSESNELIGVIYLNNIDHLNQSAELSIMIGDVENRGKGYGKSAVHQMLKHAFFNLNLNRISLTVLTDNLTAICLYEKCGFKKEGVLRQTLYKEGRWHDQIIMSILKSEFKEIES